MTDWFRVHQVRGSVRSGRRFWGLAYVSLCGLFSTNSSWNHKKWIVTKTTETNMKIKLLNKRATHEVTEFIMWLAPWAGEVNQILRSDWLPERTSWSYLARSGLPALTREKIGFFFHIITPWLTNLVHSRWLILASFFCVWTSTSSPN